MRGPLPLVLLITLLAGCSAKNEIIKSKVSGAVTYNSEPVQKGEIRFIPVSGTKGPLSTGAIVDGNYTVTAAGGVPVGTHKVEIFAYVELPKPPNAPGIAPTPREQYIPETYNKKSTLEFTVPEGREVQEDFNLEGPPRKQ